MSLFSVCIITASNERQAALYRRLIGTRLDAGLYPREIDFRVYCDPPAGRVGSGGGTLWALECFHKETGSAFLGEGRFPRTLLIHAAGESRRLPAYVPEGKLFAPVSTPSSSATAPVVLDLILTLYFKYPWRDGELLVASGDVIIDFNTELLDAPDAPICGFAAPASFGSGSKHGVFAFHPRTGEVIDYFQKADPAVLAEKARIEGSEHCAIDLGLISFRGIALDGLRNLAASRHGKGTVLDAVARSELSFDLYLELMTACLGGLDEEAYQRRVAADSKASHEGLESIFRIFSPCGLSGVLVKQAAFIHFGSLIEFPSACREARERELLSFYAVAHEELSGSAGDGAIIDNSVRTDIRVSGPGVYAENCRDVSIVCEGGNLLVGLRSLSLDMPLPSGITIDERRLSDGTTLRLVYGSTDTFKPVADPSLAVFCGVRLPDWLALRALKISDIFPDSDESDTGPQPCDPYEAFMYAALESADFLCGYWAAPTDPSAWAAAFRSAPRYSLAQANALSDPCARDAERTETRVQELNERLVSGGFFALPASELPSLIKAGLDLRLLRDKYATTDDPLLKAYRGTLLCSAGIGGTGASEGLDLVFSRRREGGTLRVAVKLDQIVWARSPVRLDLAGGWSDTPPYTNRYGGAVTNVAVDLNGQSPIQVFVRRTTEPRVVIHSIDLGVTERIETAGGIRSYQSPGNAFALPRAALDLLGLAQGLADDESLAPRLAATGGGLELTLLSAVPKGSGLGTSSILAGTVLAALERFYGIASSRDDLFLKVLEVEQMLTTGGGWQDQIGGLAGGLKDIEAKPGLKLRPVIHQLDPYMFEASECAERMTLFYTGITRLAKGLLQDVVDRVNGMDRSYLFTHRRIAELAREAREAISLRNLDLLARIVGESFKENKLIHRSTTNADMDAMTGATAEFWTGMKLLGAGGGGFAFFISRDEEAASKLRTILAERFEDERARLVDFQLNKKGLEVTVS